MINTYSRANWLYGELMNIIGRIDKKSGSKSIFGYALDTDNLSKKIEITLTIDSEKFQVECNRKKIHLNNKYQSSEHGFKLEIPPKFRDGREHLVTLIDSNQKLIDKLKIFFKLNEENTEEISKKRNKLHDLAIIIPFYNSMSTADACLQSIIHKKSIIDIEIICIDDGSTDETLKILRKYEKKDERIKVICQKNLFAGVARNNGIKNCRSRYITFIDSDDKLSSISNLEKAFFYADHNELDVLCCGAREIDCQGNSIRNIDYVLRKDFIGDKNFFKLEELKDVAFMTFSGVPWGKIYKKSIIDKYDIKFLNLKRSEDFYFVQIALMRAEKISFQDLELIQHRVGSTTNLESNKDETPLIFWEADAKFHEYVNSNRELHKFVLPMQISSMNRFFYNAVSVKKLDSFKKIIEEMNNFARKELVSVDFSSLSNASNYVLKKFNSLIFNESLLDFFFEHFTKLSYTSKVDFLTPKEKVHNLKQQQKEIGNNNSLVNSDDNACKIVIEKTRKVKPLLSVVIPVYNVENYLRKCLDSIINQKNIELEIICVDDGSTDNSLDILKEYAQKYDFITVITQKNLMAGVARNNGLKFASGEYVHFLDSDDWLNENVYEKIFSVAQCKDVNLILCSYTTYNQTTHEVKGDYFFSKMGTNMFNRVMNFEKNSRFLLNAPVVPWNKIIKRELLIKENLVFDSLKCVNDRAFNFRLLPVAKQIIIINEPLITYRVGNSKSLIGVRHKYFDCHFKSFDEIKNLYSDKSYKPYIINVFVFDLIHWLDVFSHNHDYDLEPINKSIKVFFKNNKDYFLVNNDKINEKVHSFINSYLA